MLDGYYRTIEGFEVLIEKDFLSFGHQFGVRLGCGVKDSLGEKSFSPVFIQFLDCVYQIFHQFPTLFEFNPEFLKDIAYHSFSLCFRTFIANNEREQEEFDLRHKTVSLWTYIDRKSVV